MIRNPRLEAIGLRVNRSAKGEFGVQADDFELLAGEPVELLGRSGSGKSTVLMALARLIPRAGGTLQLNGQTEHRLRGPAWRSRVRYIPQIPTALPGSLESNLLAAWTLSVRPERAAPSSSDLQGQLERVGLQRKSLTDSAARLSGGELARLCFLRAWITQPDVLLLDEVEAMLDPDSAQRVEGMIQDHLDRDGAVLRVRHTPSAFSKRVLRLEEGRLKSC